MAEYVYQNLETMLPELEEMERIGIFTKQEIKSIVKRRTAFEYKLQRKIVQEADFLRYIQYELNLDLLRKKRKGKGGISKKILSCEVIFIKRLHHVFQSAIKKFPNDVKLWMQYIDFCKRTGNKQTVGKVVGRMLQAHPNKTGLWVMAAKLEFEDNSNIKYARALMQRALRLNPNSSSLWLEYFRLELLHIDKVNKRRQLLGITSERNKDSEEPSSAEFLSGKTARIVYKNAIQSVPDDINFRLKFIDIYHLFEETNEGVNDVFESLSQDFPNSELYWNALALRNFNKAKARNATLSDIEWLELETERNKIFDKAVKEVPTEKMWNYYIDACITDLEHSGLRRRVDHALKLFKIADKDTRLTPEKYLLWVEILIKNGNFKEALKISKSSLKIIPGCALLWVQYFKINLTDTCGFTAFLLDEFSQALKQVDSTEGILSLWNLWLEHSMFLNIAETEKIFQECLTSCSNNEVKTRIKESFVELVVTKEGIKKGRKIYQKLSKEKPVSVSFFQKCIDAENSQVAPSVKNLRQLYEAALEEFGAESPGLWVDYVQLEIKNGDSQEVGKLHWRAMKALSGDKVEEFLRKYTLLLQSVS